MIFGMSGEDPGLIIHIPKKHLDTTLLASPVEKVKSHILSSMRGVVGTKVLQC
jgi:hypothetical protein